MDSGRVENLKSPSLFRVLLEEAGYPASEKTSIIWLEDCNNFTQGSCLTRGCLLSSRPTPVSPVATRPIIRVTGTTSDVGGNSWCAEELHGCCQIRERREPLGVTAPSFNLPILPFGASLVAQTVESARNTGDPALIPELGGSPGEGNGNPLQYSCLENPMDRGAWKVTVCGISQSQIENWNDLAHRHLIFRFWPRKCPFLLTNFWVSPEAILLLPERTKSMFLQRCLRSTRPVLPSVITQSTKALVVLTFHSVL